MNIFVHGQISLQISIQTKMTLLHHNKSSGKIKTVILSADKESCTVILNKNDYF